MVTTPIALWLAVLTLLLPHSSNLLKFLPQLLHRLTLPETVLPEVVESFSFFFRYYFHLLFLNFQVHLLSEIVVPCRAIRIYNHGKYRWVKIVSSKKKNQIQQPQEVPSQEESVDVSATTKITQYQYIFDICINRDHCYEMVAMYWHIYIWPM